MLATINLRILVTIMSTNSHNTDTLTLLLGKTRLAILRLLFTNPDKSYYFRQIVREAGVAVGAAQRELKLLVGAGIVIRLSREGHPFYQSNMNSSLYNEILNLIKVEKTDETGNSTSSIELFIPEETVSNFCRRNHISSLSFFGSVLREGFSPHSDIDILVDFEPAHTPGFLNLAAMEKELSGIFGGRKVDLRTPADLSRHFRNKVVKEARVIYDSAG